MRITLTASIVFLLVPASSLHGDSIVSTFCRVGLADGGEIAVSSTGECNVVGPLGPIRFPPQAEASAATGYGLLEGAFWASASVRTFAIHPGYDPDILVYTEYSTARAYAELSFHATTAGPVRPGLIDLSYFGFDSSEGNRDFHANGMIGNLFAEIQEPDGSCRGACDGTFPFILGQPFDIRVSAFAESWGNWYSLGVSTGFLDADFQLRELDGSPVDLLLDSEPPVPVPEPSTFLLLAPALSLLVLGRVVGRYLRQETGNRGKWGTGPHASFPADRVRSTPRKSPALHSLILVVIGRSPCKPSPTTTPQNPDAAPS